ncbi:MAG: class I SAM-dependent methyltransferase, partial [Pseudomonadota bacterium]
PGLDQPPLGERLMGANDPILPEAEASDVENWAFAADEWIAWTRTENHDAYWAYERAFAGFVGPGRGVCIDLGTGEGRVSRTLGELGWRMTLVEPVDALLSAAKAAASGEAYVAAKANAVPCEAGSFDLVLLYNVLMDVDDLAETAQEAARLCHPDGRVIVSIVHPILDVVHGLENGPLDPPYSVAHKVAETFTQGGLEMRFAGWRRPMSAYVAALSAAGLAITAMAEPRPDPDHPKTATLTRGPTLPVFLWLEARLMDARA